MRVNQRERVKVGISRDLPDDIGSQLRKLLTDGAGAPELDKIRVGDRMDVRLIDSDEAFRIVNLSLSEQTVRKDGDITEWNWDVTPLKSGHHDLIVSVTAILDISDRPSETFSQRVYDRSIAIEVNVPYWISQFWGANWQWILGTSGAGTLIARALGKRWRGSRGR